MDLDIGLDESTIKDLVQAFGGTTQDVVMEVRQEYGWDTANFKNGGMWDIRFNRIKSAALQHDLTVVKRKRGIWTFLCVLDLAGVLYIFSKENNLETVIKNFGKKNIHYFHAFVSLNGTAVDLGDRQMSLLPRLTDDYEERRVEEIQKILGEDYPQVEQVVFVVAKEENREIVGVEARLYSRFFEPLGSEDWSSFVPKDEYSRILGVEEGIVEDTDSDVVIPKVKDKIRRRRDADETEIALRRQKDSDAINKE